MNSGESRNKMVDLELSFELWPLIASTKSFGASG